MEPIISICIPTYNGARYLRECLDSVLIQTFTDFEVLIVDDQSSDETVSIAQEYADHDQRIQVIQNAQNLGLVGNWNRCIELAKGEWIKFVFQDDLIAPSCLEKMLAACEINDAIVFCRRDFIFEASTPDHIRQAYEALLLPEKFFGISQGKISAENYIKTILKDVQYNIVGEPTVVMLRKTIFQEFGYFEPSLIQICDFEFWIRIASNVGIVYVPETLATFRVHSMATSQQNNLKRKYRQRLEKIILINLFLTHSHYKHLRSVASSGWVSRNLVGLLRREIYFEWMVFKKAMKNSQDSNFILKEWEEFFGQFPNLPKVEQFNVIEKIFYIGLRRFLHYQYQFLEFYNMRFSKQSDSLSKS